MKTALHESAQTYPWSAAGSPHWTTLTKNNIDQSTISGLSPAEIASLPEVDYIVFGSYIVKVTGSTTTQNDVTACSEQEKEKKNDKESGKKRTTGTVVTTGTASTSLNYAINVELNIYDASGANVY